MKGSDCRLGGRLVIYGFLGCGKTTLINHLLREVFPERRVVVVENESGRESVDGDFLRGGGVRVVDLRAGCVCCTLRCELAEAIAHIEVEVAPDMLILEPSGISALEDLLSVPGFSPDGIVTLVDATRFDLLMRLNRDFYIRQFRLSPVLLLTKVDAVAAEVAVRIRMELEQINPRAYVADDYRALGADWWSEELPRRCSQYRNWLLDARVEAQEFICETFTLEGRIVSEGLCRMLSRLEALGLSPVRVKGLVDMRQGFVKVDAMAGTVETAPAVLDSGRERFLSFWWADVADRGLLRGRTEALIKECLYV